MTAEALSAGAAPPLADPSRVSGVLPVDPVDYSETSLPAAARFRVSLIGLAFGALTITAATLVAFAIVSGPFHTPLGSLA